MDKELDVLLKKEFEKGFECGKMLALIKLLHKNMISTSNAAAEAGISEDAFLLCYHLWLDRNEKEDEG